MRRFGLFSISLFVVALLLAPQSAFAITKSLKQSSSTCKAPKDRICLFNPGSDKDSSWYIYSYCGDGEAEKKLSLDQLNAKFAAKFSKIVPDKTVISVIKSDHPAYAKGCTGFTPNDVCKSILNGECKPSGTGDGKCDPKKNICAKETPCKDQGSTTYTCQLSPIDPAAASGPDGSGPGGSGSGGSGAGSPGDVGGTSIPLINPLAKTIDLNKPVQSFASRLISIMFGIAGSIALVMFVWGGFLWLISAGNPKRVQQGREVFMWSTLGLIIMFSAYVIVNYLFDSLTKL